MAHSVRQLYEKRPYPAVDLSRSRFVPIWRLPPMEWIAAMWAAERDLPERILVAGCGTGNEAFAFRRRFPRAEIVAVDFSPRSIRDARRLQKKFPHGLKIDFRVADLTSDHFGGEFDFISCHGVLSYIESPARVLQNFACHLTQDGALYLGLNGPQHFSENWRPALEQFGFDLDWFQDSPALRRLLGLFDQLTNVPERAMAKLPPEHLAGDLFGPLTANRPLEDWATLARKCGLYFRGSYAAHRALRGALNGGNFDLLLPRSRAEAHLVAEQISPSSFHHAVFTKTLAPSPWRSSASLRAAFVHRTRLYQMRLLRTKKATRGWQSIRLTSRSSNTLAEIEAPSWITEILRKKNAGRRVGETLRGDRVAGNLLRQQLYLLELLGAINLLPPT